MDLLRGDELLVEGEVVRFAKGKAAEHAVEAAQLEAVSYTHLDVYKRQSIESAVRTTSRRSVRVLSLTSM